MAEITQEIDLDHPAVGAISVFSKQAGFLPIDECQDALQAAGLGVKLLPTEPGDSVALKRAVEDVTKGNKNQRVESKGKGARAVYTIINIDRERLDLEEDSGKGIADSELSARVEHNGVGASSLVITPNDHHLADRIYDRYKFHQEHFQCSLDLSVWLSNKVFKSKELQALPRPGHGGGMYYIPRGPGFEQTKKLQEALNKLSQYSGRTLINGVKLYLQPVFHGFADCADAMVDALIDDFERACNGIESYLVDYEDGKNQVYWKGLETKLKEAQAIDNKVNAFNESCSLGVNDLAPRLQILKDRIAMAQVSVATKD